MAKRRKTNFRAKVAADVQKQKSEASSYGYLNLPKGVPIFKEDPGSRVILDIMPYEVTEERHPDRNDTVEAALVGDLWYKRPFKIHRNIGVGNDAIVCPTSIGKPCPICEYRKQLINQGADKEETDTIKLSKRVLYSVIPKNHKKYEEVPHIWDISQYLFQNLLTDELEEDEANMIFPDLEEGLSLKIRFDSKTIGGSQPFAEASRIDFIERDEPYDDSILDDVPELDKCLNILSYDALKAKFFEMETEKKETETEDEPEEETPRKRKTTSRKKKEPEPEPEEEEKPDLEEDNRAKKRAERKARQSKKKEETNKCPFKHKFGEDCDAFDDCADCDIWDECSDEQERLETE